ncbi:MAG: DUF4293 domain-containing protein [Bacteroidales bacterium]|nr:DUF4293 domain-containing protein [Bacteroidales bacterium]
MIQRAQSVYLFLVVVLMSLFIIFPNTVLFNDENVTFKFYSYGLKKMMDGDSQQHMSTLPVLILAIVISIINLYNIFLFNNRTMQMRLCVYNILLMIGLLLLLLYYFRFAYKAYNITAHHFKIIAVLPVLCIVLNIMAFSGIRRDELLVKTYERLRK